jgi:hypothetical protein
MRDLCAIRNLCCVNKFTKLALRVLRRCVFLTLMLKRKRTPAKWLHQKVSVSRCPYMLVARQFSLITYAFHSRFSISGTGTCRWGVTNNVLSQGGASCCWEVCNVCSVSGKVIRISIPRYQVAVSPDRFPSKVTKFDTQWLYPVGLCQIFLLPMWWECVQLRQTATP